MVKSDGLILICKTKYSKMRNKMSKMKYHEWILNWDDSLIIYCRHIDFVFFLYDYSMIWIVLTRISVWTAWKTCPIWESMLAKRHKMSSKCTLAHQIRVYEYKKNINKYSLIKLPLCTKKLTIKKKLSSLLSDKIFNGLIDLTAFRSFAIFNRIVGSVSVCMGPYLICCKHIVFHISSKLFDGT